MGPAHERTISSFASIHCPLAPIQANLPLLPTTKTSFRRVPQPKEHDELPILEEQEELNPAIVKKIQEVKVKWRSFIKMKECNFLEEYEVKKELGRGGFGCVYKVKGRYTGTIRAAKKIKKSQLDIKEHQRLFNEVSILQSLDHPNIVKLFEVYDMSDQYVLIMELCQGGQLFQRIAKKKVNINTVPKIMRQLLEVLTYIHSKGIVHRDIKPQNILINKQTNEIKIIDFGIAHQKKSENEILQARIGTAYYIAPQVLCKSYNEKCDVWAAGVVMFMMIFNRPPFKGASQLEIIQNILNDQILYQGRNWSDLSVCGKNLLSKMLNKRPKERLSSKQALCSEWLSLQDPDDMSKNLKATKKNMEQFGFKNRLEAVVYTYCISQLVTNEQKNGLEEIFKKVDEDHDGIISMDELRQILRERIKDEQRLQSIMRLIDLDGSGTIQYTEFLISALNPRSFLKPSHYERAFDYFDIDHSGDISYEEIAKFLEGQQSQEAILQIFKQIDDNGDGTISREQFVGLFLKSAQKSMNEISSAAKLLSKDRQNIREEPIVRERKKKSTLEAMRF